MKVKYTENVPELKKRPHPDDDCENRNRVNVNTSKKKNLDRKILEEINHQDKMEKDHQKDGIKKVKTDIMQNEDKMIENAKEESFFMLIKHHQDEFIKTRELISNQIGDLFIFINFRCFKFQIFCNEFNIT